MLGEEVEDLPLRFIEIFSQLHHTYHRFQSHAHSSTFVLLHVALTHYYSCGTEDIYNTGAGLIQLFLGSKGAESVAFNISIINALSLRIKGSVNYLRKRKIIRMFPKSWRGKFTNVSSNHIQSSGLKARVVQF